MKKDKNNKKKEHEENENEIKVEIKKGNEENTEDRTDEESAVENEQEKSQAEPTIEEIREDYENRLKEAEEKYLRLAAEFDNYKKRTARQYEDIRQSVKESILSGLLEVVDNFERAIEAAGSSSDKDSLLKGTELIYQQLKDLLKRDNVSPIKAVGEKFDPNLHEAMMQMPSDEHEEGVVMQEMQKGYKIGDRVLRFSRVVVSKGPEEPDDDESGSEE